jgi:serine/threonine-protein kinase
MAKHSPNRSAQGVASALLITFIVIIVAAIGYVGYRLIQAIGGDFGARGGGNVVEVPNVLNKAEAQANEMLRSAGLLPKTMTSNYNDLVPAGQVFQQNPEAGMRIRPGRPVNLYISLGPASFIVPDMYGEHIDNAPARLSKAGFHLGSVQKIYTKQVPNGRIINQSPKKGQEFTTAVNVDLVIADSRNPPKVSMPTLTAQPLALAEELLTRPDYNLQLALVQYVADDASPPLSVVRQDPPAGKEVPIGSRVEVDVAVPTAYKEQTQRTVNLKIPVPNGPDEQQVKIKYYDDLGEQIKLDEKHHPGEVIECSIDLEGKARILIFIGDMKTPLREEQL